MAKQNGIIKLQGKLGDISFYKSGGKHLAREKGGIPASRIASDPAFQRTRENGAEFGNAGKAGKILRTAFRMQMQTAKDKLVTSRLHKLMVKVIQADATNPRGLRKVLDAETEMLEGFEFNIGGKIGSTIFMQIAPTIDRVTGVLKVDIPAFVPANTISAPQGTTHFKLNVAGAEIDFENEIFIMANEASPEIAWGVQNEAAFSLTANVTANSTHPLFLAFGIEFYQDVNGVKYPLRNGAFNGLSLVKINGV